jgi:hypothetical protein
VVEALMLLWGMEVVVIVFDVGCGRVGLCLMLGECKDEIMCAGDFRWF